MAFLDWSNALIGDPLIEFARIVEYGHKHPKIIEGYGGYPPHPPVSEIFYRLDTAVMLTVVFLSEAPDPIKANVVQIKRIKELVKALHKAIAG